MPSDVTAKEYVNEFVFSYLMPKVTKIECPTKLNIRMHFKSYLCNKGFESQKGEDLSVKWMPVLLNKISHQLDDWTKTGVPFPCCQSDEKEELYITWKHPKYKELTGYSPISENFISVLQWIGSLSSREFLIACAVYLKMLGATKIFITDAPSDCGIDLIAKIEKSPLNSMIFFVQAKTGTLITRDTVLMEYGKYLSLPHEKINQHYREALDIDQSGDGAIYCYSIFANCSFNPPAKGISAKLGILLRSKIQIAFFISQIYTEKTLQQIKLNLGANLKNDLSLNIAERITSN